jgi:hypothetical protein
MTVKHVNPVAEKQARYLAVDNRQAEPEITRILWFPDDNEVRMVEVTDIVPVNFDDEIHPFYFPPSPEDDLPLPSATVLIRSDELGKLKLPAGWGDWTDAVEL